MKILILLLLTASAFSADTIVNIEYTDGIDEGTNTPLPTSDWRVEIAPTYTTECSDISPNLRLYKSVLIPVTSYIDRSLECNSVIHPGFEDETYITWENFGYEQRADFGIEEIICPVYGQCEMDRVVNTQNRYFATIPLENGENGTQNGAAKVFIMKLDSLTVQSLPGLGGQGGRNDLSSVPPMTRYCAKIQDATTPDATIASSKIPYATVQAYDWLPLDMGAGGANGVDASSGKRVEVYEGISPTTLNRLKNEYFQ